MAGNEKQIVEFLFNNLNQISLNHIGLVTEIGLPIKKNIHIMSSVLDIQLLSTADSSKKADVYLNGKGISLKQRGGCFPYNRAQRTDLLLFLNNLDISNIAEKIKNLDTEILTFHKGIDIPRNKDWRLFFSKSEFKKICQYLMMDGSPKKISSHKAEFLLEGIFSNNNCNLMLYTFEEFFEKYIDKFKISLRRQWVGQASESEHKRAVGLIKKKDNLPWVFNNIAGEPKIHLITGKKWRDDFPEDQRKTVYFLMIEKTA